ncbi:MAG TPA: response regulator [Acidiferrobacterales bacterium]
MADKVRVLVIDDSRVMRKAVERVLNQEFEIVEAEDGEAGWEQLVRDSSIQVAISDVQMPRLDGYSLICRIRAADQARISDLPIIVMTGAEDDITRERAFACGANDFITKPIDSAQLLSCVRGHTHNGQGLAGVADAASALGEESNIDPLTKLSSRRHLMECGADIVAAARKGKKTLSLIQLAVDNFAALRTQHGDDIADQVLIWLAKELKTRTRKDDTVARLGSAEITILTSSSGRVEIAMLCERLRAAVAAKPFGQNGHAIPVTISIGLVTLGHDPGDTLEAMLNLARRRLKLAAAAGGNRMVAGDESNLGSVEEAVMEAPTLDKALAMLGGNQAGQLGPYALQLTAQVLPLIEFCNKRYSLEIDAELKAIKEAIQRAN